MFAVRAYSCKNCHFYWVDRSPSFPNCCDSVETQIFFELSLLVFETFVVVLVGCNVLPWRMVANTIVLVEMLIDRRVDLTKVINMFCFRYNLNLNMFSNFQQFQKHKN